MRNCFAVALLLLAELGSSQAAPSPEQAQALDYLNQQRDRAGMPAFAWEPRLAGAAAGHAKYLVQNLQVGHGQEEGKPGFTGLDPGRRALAAGFQTNRVTENIHVSVGSFSGVREWVDNLFTAIYHRQRFLDFNVDLVGLGVARADLSGVVFAMANGGQERLCSDRGPPFEAGSYYYGICRDSERRVPAEAWEGAREQVQAANPPVVVWPFDGARDVIPVFAEESPDPLPDLEVSGNPISLHFNPARFSAVGLERFELFQGDSHIPEPAVRLMHSGNDPHGLLTPLDFVLFPLHRLEWNRRYRVEGDYRAGGELHVISWTFRTRDPGVPVLTLTDPGASLSPPRGSVRFAVYVPPSLGVPIIRSVRYRSTTGMGVKSRIYDVNTLLFELTNPRTRGVVEVHLGDALRFRLKLG